MAVSAGMFPLLNRSAHEVMFRLPNDGITAHQFLAAATQIADSLPDAPFVINACRERLWFTLTFAAALLRNQTTLLCGERSVEQMQRLAEDYPGLYLATDEMSQADAVAFDGILPGHIVAPVPFSASAGAMAMPSLSPDHLAAIVFTSGSTGAPVAHPKSWGALFERSVDAAEFFGFGPDHPVQVVGMVPPQHMYGFETTVLLPMHIAAATWCGAAFYPQDVAAALSAVPEPRVLVTTPLQIAALLRSSVQLPPLYRIISATAPLARELALAAEQCWDTELHEIFGATEVGSIAGRRTTQQEVWQTYPRVHLELEGAADEQDARAGAPFAAPYKLNDLIELLDSRHFRLLGRRSDVIKLAGRRASLAQLNSILSSIEGVIDGQFVAPADLETQPNARLQVFAVAPQLSADAILLELRSRIDPVFLPRRVVLLDRLPRNETGKLTAAAIAALHVG